MGINNLLIEGTFTDGYRVKANHFNGAAGSLLEIVTNGDVVDTINTIKTNGCLVTWGDNEYSTFMLSNILANRFFGQNVSDNVKVWEYVRTYPKDKDFYITYEELDRLANADIDDASVTQRIKDFPSYTVRGNLDHKADISIYYNPSLNKLIYPVLTKEVPEELSGYVLLDSLIADLIVAINNKHGVGTKFCCSGHEGDPNAYIMFKDNNDATKDLTEHMLKLYGRFADKTGDISNQWMAAKVETTIDDGVISIVMRFDCTFIDRDVRYRLFDYLAKNI